MRIELFSRRWAYLGGLQWFFRIRASNGEIVASSEAYRRKIDAMSTIQLLRDQLPTADFTEERVERMPSRVPAHEGE